MINLEQVKLLEAKVGKAIDCIERLTDEKDRQRQKEANLQEKLEAQQKRAEELELLVVRIKEEQDRIEDSILAALDRLNQFEDAIEKSLRDKPAKSLQAKTKQAANDAGEEKICFEIPETDTEDDILDPLEALEELPAVSPSPPHDQSGELDIF